MPKVISIKRVTDSIFIRKYDETERFSEPYIIVPATHEVTLLYDDGGVIVGVTGKGNDLSFMTEKDCPNRYTPLSTPRHIITKDMLKEHLEVFRQAGQHPNTTIQKLVAELAEYAPDIRFTEEAADYLRTFGENAVYKTRRLNERY